MAGSSRGSWEKARQRALRPHLLEQRDPPPPHRPLFFSDHDRQNRALAQDHAQEFFSETSFESIEEAQAALDIWVKDYNHERDHQSLGDVSPIRRLELAKPASLLII